MNVGNFLVQITRAYNQKQVEDLKDEVRREQLAAAGKPSQQLNFIDAIQRLGVAYHFEEEIEEALRHICDDHHYSDDKYDDLYNVSLRFRLLRQQGYNISCGKAHEYIYIYIREEGFDIFFEFFFLILFILFG